MIRYTAEEFIARKDVRSLGPHTYVCPECGKIKETYYPGRVHRCSKCHVVMTRSFAKRIDSGDYSHKSDALAISPLQMEEHGKLFPDIKVHPDGCPEFTSVKQQDDYMKKCGFNKHTQKIRGLGKVKIS